MLEALAQQRASAVARGMHHPVGEPDRPHPGERGGKRGQQHSRSERLVHDARKQNSPDCGAAYCRNRIPDEQSEGHAGDCPDPDPHILQFPRESAQLGAPSIAPRISLIGDMGVHGNPYIGSPVLNPVLNGVETNP